MCTSPVVGYTQPKPGNLPTAIPRSKRIPSSKRADECQGSNWFSSLLWKQMGVFQLTSFQSFLSVIMIVVVLHSSRTLHFIVLQRTYSACMGDGMGNVCDGVGWRLWASFLKHLEEKQETNEINQLQLYVLSMSIFV